MSNPLRKAGSGRCGFISTEGGLMRFTTGIMIAWTVVCAFGLVMALASDVSDVALMWGQMLVAYWGGVLTMLGKGE